MESQARMQAFPFQYLIPHGCSAWERFSFGKWSQMATFTYPCIYIADVSTVCTFSVLFKCNIAPYCAMINIWAYNYHGIESYKSIWVLYTNIIALLLFRNQAVRLSGEFLIKTIIKTLYIKCFGQYTKYGLMINNKLVCPFVSFQMRFALSLSFVCAGNIEPLILTIYYTGWCHSPVWLFSFLRVHLEHQGTVWPQHVATRHMIWNKTLSEETHVLFVWSGVVPSVDRSRTGTISCWGLRFTSSLDIFTVVIRLILKIHKSLIYIISHLIHQTCHVAE